MPGVSMKLILVLFHSAQARLRGEGVLAGDLFFVVVGDRRAVVHAAEAVDSAGIEQQRGEQLRLAGAAMADERDISQAGAS